MSATSASDRARIASTAASATSATTKEAAMASKPSSSATRGRASPATQIASRRRDLERHALDDLQPETVEGDVLRRVVRHQPHLPDAEIAKDLTADSVVADVGGEAELLVRGDGVEPLLLELVRTELVEEADA